MATQSVRIGWRPYVNQAAANLLDSYSGAAAAYSLRKLKSSYTGSAIRVRRSSDNTELNIGFDSDGNLDTYALSVFVGTGHGYVTTWYDQSGNGKNAIQTTAIRQPWIIESGVLLTSNDKTGIKFMSDASGSYFLTCAVNRTNNNEAMSMYAVYRLLTTIRQAQFGWGVTELEPGANSNGIALHQNGVFAYSPNNAAYWSTNLALGSVVFTGGLITNNTIYYNGVARASTITNGGNGNMQIGGTLNIGKGAYSGAKSVISELIFYPNGSQNSNVSLINNDINSYYSIYPNPSSVWNLLTAAYNADTKSLPSLKTSLVASYNGESNANDSFGTNNGTAVGGLTYTTGKIGNAFSFNGSNSYVKLTTDTMKFAGDFSISAWCYFSGASANTQTIFSNLTYDGTYGYGYYLYYMNNTLTFQINNSLPFASGGNVQLNYGVNIFNGWHLVTVTRKSSTGTKMYLNGNLVANNTSTYNPNYHSNMIPSIGSTDYGTTYNGLVSYYSNSGTKIDALNTWTKELTASEVSELYNSGNGAQYIVDNFYKPTTNDALLVNNGTAQGGLTYEVGKVGTAFVFNGTNAYVQLGDVMDLGLSSWSYGMWFKSAVASSGTLFSKSIAAGLAGRFAAYIDSNRINFIFDYNSPLNSAGNTVNIGTSNTIVTNTWYHLVCVFDRTSNIRLYLNGVLQSVTTSYGVNDLSQYGAANTNYNTSCPFRIGAYTAADNINAVSFFNGSIDAFNVWNRVLTASEITELYNSGNGKQYPN